MTPTQAQIDAAALRRWQDVVTQAMACIRGETPEDVSFGEAEDDTFAKLRQVDAEMAAALTAAAEVGDDLSYVSIRNATIERCVQVALEQRCERRTPWDTACVAIADAIRALATQP